MGDDKLESAEIDIYKEATISSISSFIGTIISLALVVVVTYYLSVEEVGTFFFYATFVFFLAQVPKGFGLAVRKRVSSVSKNKSSYYFSGFLMLLLYIVVSVIGLILFEPVVETYTEISIESSELILTGFVASSKGFNTYSRKYYAGCGFPAKSENIRNYLGRGSQVLLILFLLQFANSTVTLALLGYGLGPFISFIAVIFLSPLKYESPNVR